MSSSSGSSTVIMSNNGLSMSSSRDLSSSNSSLSPSRQSSSHLSKVYKQASQLFLTRRLAEALSILEPVVSTPRAVGEDDSSSKAPVALSSPSQRIKLWSLYITLLNSICDLTDDEGRQEFGTAKFKTIESEVRSGEIWEAVIREGYSGREAALDAEVVYNLATLLLGQAQDQKLTQQRLETYLSSSPDLDISGHLQRSPSRRSRTNGTNTPRDLSSRVKIVELFTLHVLPRNEEWDYARSFISNSDILDEERREAFLQTLEELRDVQEPEEPIGESLVEEREDIRKREYLADSRRTAAVAARQPSEASVVPAQSHKRSGSEVDYGIDSPPDKASNGTAQPPATKILTPKAAPPAPATAKGKGTQAISPKSRTKANGSKTDIISRAQNMVRFLQNLVKSMTGNLAGNPSALLKMLVFIVALLGLFGRGEVRDKLRRVFGGSWDKVKGTIGMGVKVSYI